MIKGIQCQAQLILCSDSDQFWLKGGVKLGCVILLVINTSESPFLSEPFQRFFAETINKVDRFNLSFYGIPIAYLVVLNTASYLSWGSIHVVLAPGCKEYQYFTILLLPGPLRTLPNTASPLA